MFQKIFLLVIMVLAINLQTASAANWEYVTSFTEAGIEYYYLVDTDSIAIDRNENGVLEFHLIYRTNCVDPFYYADFVIGKECFMKNDNGRFYRIPYCIAYDHQGNEIYDSSQENRQRKYKPIPADSISEAIFKFGYARL